MGGDQTFDEDDDEEEGVQTPKKRAASVPALKSQVGPGYWPLIQHANGEITCVTKCIYLVP